MRIADLLNTVQYVTDRQGRRTAVVVDVEKWEQIVAQLQSFELAKSFAHLAAHPAQGMPGAEWLPLARLELQEEPWSWEDEEWDDEDEV